MITSYRVELRFDLGWGRRRRRRCCRLTVV